MNIFVSDELSRNGGSKRLKWEPFCVGDCTIKVFVHKFYDIHTRTKLTSVSYFDVSFNSLLRKSPGYLFSNVWCDSIHLK